VIVLPGSEVNYPPGSLAAALERRRGVLPELVRADTVVDVGLLPPGSPSVRVAGLHAGLLAPLDAPMAARARQAEADGYDAVVVYGMFDPGAEAARRAVRIPVIGTGRAGLLLAAALGARVGGLVYERPLLAVADSMLRAYQLERYAAGLRALEIPPTEMPARAEEVRARMFRLAHELVEQDGAEVILPLGMSMLPTIVQADELAAEVGVPVVDGLRAAVRLAETTVLLGLSQSSQKFSVQG
jgi:allantoin racemase